MRKFPQLDTLDLDMHKGELRLSHPVLIDLIPYFAAIPTIVNVKELKIEKPLNLLQSFLESSNFSGSLKLIHGYSSGPPCISVLKRLTMHSQLLN